MFKFGALWDWECYHCKGRLYPALHDTQESAFKRAEYHTFVGGYTP